MIRARRLASELRRLREAAGLTRDEVAIRLECSTSKISRIETGRVAVSPRDVRDLARIYGVSEDVRESLIQLARESRQKGWWQAYANTIEPYLSAYLGLQSAASEIRHYSVTRIPGLLQTEEYMRAVVTGGLAGPGRYPGPADAVAEMLTERQRHAAASPPKIWAVMDEAALRRQVGGRDIMRRQIEHLIGLSSARTTFLQFIPYTGGSYLAMDQPFVMLAFPHPADPAVVGVGYPTGMLWIEDPAEVDRYNRIFCHLQAAALSPEDSATLMTVALKEL